MEVQVPRGAEFVQCVGVVKIRRSGGRTGL